VGWGDTRAFVIRRDRAESSTCLEGAHCVCAPWLEKLPTPVDGAHESQTTFARWTTSWRANERVRERFSDGRGERGETSERTPLSSLIIPTVDFSSMLRASHASPCSEAGVPSTANTTRRVFGGAGDVFVVFVGESDDSIRGFGVAYRRRAADEWCGLAVFVDVPAFAAVRGPSIHE